MLRITDFTASFILIILLALTTSYKEAEDESLPEENRFKRVVLVDNLCNPVGLEAAPDGSIYMIEGNGRVSRVNPQTKAVTLLGTIKKNKESDAERGLIGMALDPDFERTHWIYLQYFLPASKVVTAQISRFTIAGDSILEGSEKKLVETPYQSNCCHYGSGMGFDSKGNLYFATGDNSSAFITGYSPHDENNENNNSLRSAANTMDLRGKICRIHPEKDGTYTIPKDNLFADGRSGRAEIYIMGCRNPFQIFVDKATDVLYWGEVGPDAPADSVQGPMGYDEYNIAAKAGNYGWPMFIADNKPYVQFDFITGKAGEKFNAEHPVNNSRFNTGIKDLPPARKATIWYPYSKSKEFPQMGEGGRTAIGGPVYHYDPDLKSSVKFPKYFDKAWFISDWMRSWIKAVHLDGDRNFERMDNFMASTKFNKPVAMTFSPKDGCLYVLEFGTTRGGTPEAGLVKIEYIRGNRKPIAKLETDKQTGKQPLTVQFSARKSSDYDRDALTYTWFINGKKLDNSLPELKYTFRAPGVYDVSLTVTDPSGAGDKQAQQIKVGNSMPSVSFVLENYSFYRDDMPYKVKVTDAEDGQLGNGISPESVKVNGSYHDRTGRMVINTEGMIFNPGEVLINESDCKGCHAMNTVATGPGFMEISHRYLPQFKKDDKIADKLADKILKGGNGAWYKDRTMSAHPQLTKDQATDMVKYILSLGEKKEPARMLQVSGKLTVPQDVKPRKEGIYILQASYTDKGGNGIEPLHATAREILRHPKIYAEDFDETPLFTLNKKDHSISAQSTRYAVMHNVDLTGIRQITIRAKMEGGYIEMRTDSLTGSVVASFPTKNPKVWMELSRPLNPIQGKHDVYFRYINAKLPLQYFYFDWVRFERGT